MRLEPAGRYANARTWPDLERSAGRRAGPRVSRSVDHPPRPLVSATRAVGRGVAGAACRRNHRAGDQQRDGGRPGSGSPKRPSATPTAEAETAKALGQAIEALASRRSRPSGGRHGIVGQFIDMGDRQLLARLPAASRRPFLERATEFNRQFREREPENLSLRQSG